MIEGLPLQSCRAVEEFERREMMSKVQSGVAGKFDTPIKINAIMNYALPISFPNVEPPLTHGRSMVSSTEMHP
jgi:hypothetical protein